MSVERITFVVEYESDKCPVIKAGMEILGGRVCSVGFYDALAEIEVLEGQLEEVQE